jgi:iron complex transport system substrate-binding protein
MKAVRAWLFGLMLAGLLLGLVACTRPAPTGYPVTFDEITLTETPRRVVSLSPALTEQLYMLGYGGRLVGVSRYCDRPGAAGELTRCGIAQDPDLEAIYALKPDLLLTGERLYTDALDALAEMGVPVLTLPRAEDMEGIVAHLSDLLLIFSGDIKGPQLAEQVRYFAYTQTDYVTASVRDYLSREEENLSAVYLARPEFTLATGDTIEGRLLTDMGLINPAEHYTGWAFPPDESDQLKPDLIFYSDALSPDDLSGSAVYGSTAAVTAERLYPVDTRSLERQSPAMFLQLEQTARLAFPKAFTTPRPDLAPPAPAEPEPEPRWYQRLFSPAG